MRLADCVAVSAVFSFNPRTHMGCDLLDCDLIRSPFCFNPRTHMGCDLGFASLASTTASFNPRTHMGCDLHCRLQPACPASFNPRTHMGCDQASRPAFKARLMFQSTHPHGVRLVFHLLDVEQGTVSIHAPTWGATPRVTARYTLCNRFNPRTHMGCDFVWQVV